MQRGHSAEAVHLSDREVAHTDGTDLPLLVSERMAGRFLPPAPAGRANGPVDVDVVGTQAAQRIIDFPQDSSARRVAIDLSVAPFQSALVAMTAWLRTPARAAPTISSETPKPYTGADRSD